MAVQGYDDPIDEAQADLLGRAAFARGLANLSVANPGWPTRIGVYGRWGEGKTTVVQLAQKYLRDQGHLTADFNPWGCRDSNEMISLLAKVILKVMKENKITVPGGLKRGAKKAAAVVASSSKAAEDLSAGDASAALAARAVAQLSPGLKRWAGDQKDDIEKALGAIEPWRKLVVFVDDVDRLDPKLLPDLMFALYDVFAIPCVTFIVALDPTIVGAALNEYHRGFGDGLAFLEKIIQFPRWLPPVADEDVQRLAQAERSRHTDFIDAKTFGDNRDILPRNPRELKMLIRGLLPLKDAFSRHDPVELDQNLLVLLACFRQRFPHTLMQMLDDEALLDQCLSPAKKDDFVDRFVKPARALAVRCNELGKEEDTSARSVLFDRLAAAFGNGTYAWNAKLIRYHSNLTDRPHALTWKEFRGLLDRHLKSATELDSWTTEHARQVEATATEVAGELFDSLVRYHDTTMNESAAAATTAAHTECIARATAAVHMMGLLWRTSSHAPGLRTPGNFRAVVGTFRNWIHFNLTDADRTLRGSEAALLDDMIKEIQGADSATAYLATLEPWKFHDFLSEERDRLTSRITKALLHRAAAGEMDRFATPSAIATMVRSNQDAAHYVLTQLSPTWSDDGRLRLQVHANREPGVVAINLRYFVEQLTKLPRPSPLLAERDLIELWWNLITAVRWQPRFFSGLETLKTQLEAGTPLPPPPWWSDAQRAAAALPRDTPAAPIAATTPTPEISEPRAH
jgi:KAP family P-loop domain